MGHDQVGRLRPYLREREGLLWVGQPDPRVRFTRADWFLVPFSVLWGGFAITWTVLATVGAHSFGLFGVPFVLVGLYMMAGRFIVKTRRKRATLYAVTSERGLIVVGNRTMRESPLRNQPFEMRRSRDGRHVSVIVGPSNWSGSQALENTGWDPLSLTGPGFAFWDVADPDGLLRAIDRVRR